MGYRDDPFRVIEWVLLGFLICSIVCALVQVIIGATIRGGDLRQRLEEDEDLWEGMAALLDVLYEVTVAVVIIVLVSHLPSFAGIFSPQKSLRTAMMIVFEVFGSFALIAVIICTAIFAITTVAFEALCAAVDREIKEQDCYECEKDADTCQQEAIAEGTTCWYDPKLYDELCVDFAGQLNAITAFQIMIDIFIFVALVLGCVTFGSQQRSDNVVVVTTTQAEPQPQAQPQTVVVGTPVAVAYDANGQPMMMAQPSQPMMAYDPNMQMQQQPYAAAAPMGDPNMQPPSYDQAV